MTDTTGPDPEATTGLLTDAELEKLRPGSTRPWNPAAAERYVCGLGAGGWHAVPRASASELPAAPGAPRKAGAVCGEWAQVPDPLRGYDRLSWPLTFNPCRRCAWQLAIETGSTGRELALIIPDPAEAAAIARSAADPTLAVRVCEAILLAAHRGGSDDGPEEDLDSRVTVELLALVSRHRPVLFFSEACAEGDCEQPEDLAGEPGGPECRYPCAAAGCGACTPCAGRWAGEWEGSVLGGLRVPSPCSVLALLAARYRLAGSVPGQLTGTEAGR